jgi:hypothetical protein
MEEKMCAWVVGMQWRIKSVRLVDGDTDRKEKLRADACPVGPRWCPDKRLVYRPTWIRGEPIYGIL